MTSSSIINLLLVDDDEVCVMAVRRALRKLQIANTLHTAKNGIEALELIRGQEDGTALQRPFLILLDINMPRMDGFEFLTELRADPKFASSIIFMLTTSSQDADIERAYRDFHVAGYVVKSDAERCLLDALKMIGCYWQTVELPLTAAQ